MSQSMHRNWAPVAELQLQVLFLLLAACGSEPATGTGSNKTASNKAGSNKTSAPTKALHLADDFESGRLAPFWLPGNYGSGRYEPGAVKLVQEHPRSGSTCVQITVRQGDIEQRGDSDQLNERAELDSGKRPLLGRTVDYRFSVRIARDFPIVNLRLVIAQFKQQRLAGSPIVAQRFRKGRHYLTVRSLGFLDDTTRYELPALRPDRWHDMHYRIRYSTARDGRVQVWMNGRQVVDHKGRTAHPDARPNFYNKFGLYRDRWPVPMTIWFDDYELKAR